MRGGSLFGASVTALVAAGLAAGFALVLWFRAFDVLTLLVVAGLAMAVALPHFLFLGFPLYLYLGAKRPVGWGTASLLGFLTGGLPVPLLLLLAASRKVGVADPAGLLPLILWFGSAGVAGALAFRAVYGAELGGPPA